MVDRIEELDCWLLVVPVLNRLLVRAGLSWLLLLLLRLELWLLLKLLSRNIVGGPRPLTIHQCQYALSVMERDHSGLGQGRPPVPIR